MSDWFAVKDTVGPIKAGLDVEMPFPVFRGPRLLAAIDSGDITEAEIDARAEKMLDLRDRTIACHAQNPERSEISLEANALAREIANSGMVLLKNDSNTLPIPQTARVALIGGFAKDPVFTGGGSASCTPQYRDSPLDVLSTNFTQLEFASGVRTRRIIPMASREILRAQNGETGADIFYFNEDQPETPVIVEHNQDPNIWMLGEFKRGLKVPGSYVKLSTTLTPTTSGVHTLAVRGTGSYTMTVDGKQIASEDAVPIATEQFIFNHVLLERRTQIEMQAGNAYDIEIVMQGPQKLTTGEPTPYALLLAFEEALSETDAINEAVDIAKAADISIIYAGRDAQYESEGFDLHSIKLPANQARLIRAVASASKKTVVVLHAGNPIDVSAIIDCADAILLAHFPGQEGARGAADILTGRVCPSGRLATTWFKTLEDSPSHKHFPPKQGQDGNVVVQYAEGICVGYRAPDRDDRVCWPFGFGLSYTSFDYTKLVVDVTASTKSSRSKLLKCQIRVKNTGTVAGREVVQLYITPPSTTKVWRPARELKAFCKTALLNPDEEQSIDLEVDLAMACSYWMEDKRSWRLEKGVYGVFVGGQHIAFSNTEEYYWNHL